MIRFVVPAAIVIASIIVAADARSPRGERRHVPVWQRAAAWLAVAKASRFVLEFAIAIVEIAAGSHGLDAAARYRLGVGTAYFFAAGGLALCAKCWLRAERGARTVAIGTGVTLVAIELVLVVVRYVPAIAEVSRGATGLAAASTRGTVLMTLEALAVGLAGALTSHRGTTPHDAAAGRAE